MLASAVAAINQWTQNGMCSVLRVADYELVDHERMADGKRSALVIALALNSTVVAADSDLYRQLTDEDTLPCQLTLSISRKRRASC